MEPSQHSISMLIVEDEKVTREVIVVMISRKFPDVATYIAENGKVGVELFKEHAPEIVITDIQMPVMDGIEMAGEIKSLNAGTKIIVLTAFDSTDFYEKFKEIGFHDFLPKPIDFGKLFAAIEKCLAEIAMERRLAHLEEMSKVREARK
jgi:two-component system sensor histidine kinase/response regulator